jgi:membrane protein implicated in regulation of membrane protease activity
MIRVYASIFLSAALVLATVSSHTLAQSPPDAGGSGTVIAVNAHGMATVQVGDKQRMVSLPDARVGDPVECKDYEGKWKCIVRPE